MCSAARRKGRAICANDTHLPIEATESAVLGVVERELLDVQIFEVAIERAAARLAMDTPARAGLIAERDRIVRELSNLTAAIAAGGDIPTLVAEVRTREARRRELDRSIYRPTLASSDLKASLSAKLTDWRRLLHSRPHMANAC